MKLKEWNARLHGLVIFRTLLEDPVLAKLLDLTDRMEAGAGGMGPVCDAVAQFEAALFERTTDWSQYLSTAVLEAETVCVRQAAAWALGSGAAGSSGGGAGLPAAAVRPDTGCPAGRGRGPGRRAGLPAPVGDGRP